MTSSLTKGLSQGDFMLLNVLYNIEMTDILTLLGSGGGGGSPNLSDHTTTAVLTALLAGKVSNSSVLTNLPSNALFTDTVYNKLANEPISYITRLTTLLAARISVSLQSLLMNFIVAALLDQHAAHCCGVSGVATLTAGPGPVLSLSVWSVSVWPLPCPG